jgi:hypothetical protein
MITIAEVIEQCAQEVRAECIGFADDDMQLNRIIVSIRALAAKYEGCIVAEGEPVGHACRAGGGWVDCSIKPAPLPADGSHLQLYRAKAQS